MKLLVLSAAIMAILGCRSRTDSTLNAASNTMQLSQCVVNSEGERFGIKRILETLSGTWGYDAAANQRIGNRSESDWQDPNGKYRFTIDSKALGSFLFPKTSELDGICSYGSGWFQNGNSANTAFTIVKLNGNYTMFIMNPIQENDRSKPKDMFEIYTFIPVYGASQEFDILYLGGDVFGKDYWTAMKRI